MNARLSYLLLLITVCYFVLLSKLLSRRKLNLSYSLLWLFLGGVMLAGILMPDILISFANFMGIIVPSNALFLLGGSILLLIIMLLTSLVSIQNDKIKHLVQEFALLEKRIRMLEKERPK